MQKRKSYLWGILLFWILAASSCDFTPQAMVGKGNASGGNDIYYSDPSGGVYSAVDCSVGYYTNDSGPQDCPMVQGTMVSFVMSVNGVVTLKFAKLSDGTYPVTAEIQYESFSQNGISYQCVKGTVDEARSEISFTCTPAAANVSSSEQTPNQNEYFLSYLSAASSCGNGVLYTRISGCYWDSGATIEKVPIPSLWQ